MEKQTYYQLNRERINALNKARYWKNKKPVPEPTEEENEEQFRRIREHVRYIRELQERKNKPVEATVTNCMYYWKNKFLIKTVVTTKNESIQFV